MMWEVFSQAFALMLIFEGLMPFASPNRWRELILRLAQSSEQTLRTYGFISMMVGVLILWFIHQYQ